MKNRSEVQMLQFFVVPFEWVVYGTIETLAAGHESCLNLRGLTQMFMYRLGD